jgi:hypothetical protein
MDDLRMTTGTGLAVVFAGSLLHCFCHKTSAAEDGDLGAVGSSQNQHIWVQGGVVAGWEVQVQPFLLAKQDYDLRLATCVRIGIPQDSDLSLPHLS